ncbi:MAG: hypothetical protein D8H99_54095 [Streptococcus sp.]|nr:MAG: hypothetical protein D8H99_54095 [Streptococcus sp.]
MQYRITSARYCFDEMKVYEQYRAAFDKFGAKISSDIETGNISILVDFETTEELMNFSLSVGAGLYFSCPRSKHIPEIWIKDGYME